MKSKPPLDELASASASLKDFQRDTAEYVFRRLYVDKDGCRRLLIADEVGLGKTLVARGVIAKALAHLWGNVPRIDIIYVCSNADIAEQNINRLQILKNKRGAFRQATRLTLLATEVAQLGDVNFIALTPNTSFELGTSLGIAKERALLYWLLKDAWGFGASAAPYNILRGNAERTGFRELVQRSRPDPTTIEKVAKRFKTALENESELHREFDELCETFAHDRKSPPRAEANRRNQFVGRTRRILANVCINELSPDLVILDEFQRFKDLLGTESEASELAQQLFDYSDEHSQAKVLLLSATPYKMLTLDAQDEDEDHYKDFLKTLAFLVPEKERFKEYEQAVHRFRKELLQLPSGGQLDQVVQAKERLEELLRKVLVRTERLASTPDRGGMLQERPLQERLDAVDLLTYVHAHRAAATLEERDLIELWKSAPYLLSFSDGYKLRDRLKAAADDGELGGRVAGLLSRCGGAIVPILSVKRYRRLPAANPRMRGLLNDYVDAGAWKLLWIPPALPYYRLSGAFGGSHLGALTKRLVFSSWRMVPRSVCAVIGHNVVVNALASANANRPTGKSGDLRLPTRLLRFQRDSDRRLTGMPLFGLIYPSWTLATEIDPLTIGRELFKTTGELPGYGLVKEAVRAQIKVLLSRARMPSSPSTGAVDEHWYGLAPAFIDRHCHRKVIDGWLEGEDLPEIWKGMSEGDGDEADKHWTAHVDEFRSLVEAKALGKVPDDLVDVLAELCIASPAIVALRALLRGNTALSADEKIVAMDGAAAIGWAFRNLMNLPDSIAILRSGAQTEPHWKRVLEYCAEGCLQAVMDEYLHALIESNGLTDKPFADRVTKIADQVTEGLGLRPSTIGFDDIKVTDDSLTMELQRIPSRFAMPLVEQRNLDAGTAVETESARSRTGKVRNAFNSPFWPFLLASTSIGQEGLDFHTYCHAVVHWNLPSNPVDLEQREGRVHRFKGHAVRKNVAAKWGGDALLGGASNIWEDMFNRAKAARGEGESDLIPYWLYPGDAAIERHVPVMPLNREATRMADLRRTLAVYRMVFGQPRQQDLIEYLMSFGKEQVEALSTALRIDLSPPKVGGTT